MAVEVLPPDDGRDPRRMRSVEERLDRIEVRLERGGGGVGCCGFVLLLYVIYLLQQILAHVEHLPS